MQAFRVLLSVSQKMASSGYYSQQEDASFDWHTCQNTGIEMQMATNHVAHYYLTMLLLPVLESSAPSRVVVVSSEGHRFLSFTRGGFDCEKFNDEEGYSGLWQYGASKVKYMRAGELCLYFLLHVLNTRLQAANIMFTIELARRLKEKGVEASYQHIFSQRWLSAFLIRIHN